MKHKHTALTAAQAVRALLLRTSRIARTWPEYWQQQADDALIRPAERGGSSTWANAYQACRLVAEQVHGPGHPKPGCDYRAIEAAVAEAMPELFAEYWDKLPGEVTP